MSAPPILSADVSESLASLWTRHTGKRPTSSRTEIHGNVVTCVLVDAVADFNRSPITPQDYNREAVAAIVSLTRQRVASFVSDHDRDTGVATEVFTLEPSLSRGAPGPRAASG